MIRPINISFSGAWLIFDAIVAIEYSNEASKVGDVKDYCVIQTCTMVSGWVILWLKVQESGSTESTMARDTSHNIILREERAIPGVTRAQVTSVAQKLMSFIIDLPFGCQHRIPKIETPPIADRSPLSTQNVDKELRRNMFIGTGKRARRKNRKCAVLGRRMFRRKVQCRRWKAHEVVLEAMLVSGYFELGIARQVAESISACHCNIEVGSLYQRVALVTNVLSAFATERCLLSKTFI